MARRSLRATLVRIVGITAAMARKGALTNLGSYPPIANSGRICQRFAVNGSGSVQVPGTPEYTARNHRNMRLFTDFFGGMKKLPFWVFIWVNFILGPVASAPFVLVFFDQHPVIVCGLLGTLFAVPPNAIILYRQRGVSKLLSVPHLAWFPFVAYQLYWLTYKGLTTTDGIPFYYALAAVTVLGTSLVFDVKDAVQWLAGDREILRPE